MDVAKIIYEVKEAVKATNNDANLTDALILHHTDILRAKYIRQHQRRNLGEDKVGFTQTFVTALESVDRAVSPVLAVGLDVIRTVTKMPRFIGRGILHNIVVRPIDRISYELAFMDKSRAVYASSSNTSSIVVFIDDDNFMYLLTPKGETIFIENIAVTGILEVPKEIERINDYTEKLVDYPITHNIWAQLKPELLQALLQTMNIPEDTIDDNKTII